MQKKNLHSLSMLEMRMEPIGYQAEMIGKSMYLTWNPERS